MNVPDDRLLSSFRNPGNCELCGKFCSMCCAAHIFSKGSGRVDHMMNLVRVGLSAVAHCRCHHDSHATQNPSRAKLLEVVAKREGFTAEFIESVIMAVRACPWQATFEQAENWLLSHFADKVVAEAAIAIVKRNYE